MFPIKQFHAQFHEPSKHTSTPQPELDAPFLVTELGEARAQPILSPHCYAHTPKPLSPLFRSRTQAWVFAVLFKAEARNKEARLEVKEEDEGQAGPRVFSFSLPPRNFRDSLSPTWFLFTPRGFRARASFFQVFHPLPRVLPTSCFCCCYILRRGCVWKADVCGLCACVCVYKISRSE